MLVNLTKVYQLPVVPSEVKILRPYQNGYNMTESKVIACSLGDLDPESVVRPTIEKKVYTVFRKNKLYVLIQHLNLTAIQRLNCRVFSVEMDEDVKHFVLMAPFKTTCDSNEKCCFEPNEKFSNLSFNSLVESEISLCPAESKTTTTTTTTASPVPVTKNLHLYVYDLIKGVNVYHTSIVIGGLKEVSYSGDGVTIKDLSKSENSTIPMHSEMLGTTNFSYEEIDKKIDDLKMQFSPGNYSALNQNSNHFSDKLARELVFTGIPSKYLEQSSGGSIAKKVFCFLGFGGLCDD